MKEVVEHLRQLAKETDKVKRSEHFKRFLITMARFWKYSYHNWLLFYVMSWLPSKTL